MGVIIKENKLIIIITDPRTIYFDFPKDIGNNLMHEIEFITKQNEFLA